MGLTSGPRGKTQSRRKHTNKSGKPKVTAGLAARQIALDAFVRVTTEHATLDEALDTVHALPRYADVADQDRRLARAIAVIGFRHFGRIDKRIDKFLKRPLPKKAEKVRTILKLGLAQLDYMNVPDHAAVSLTVDLARSDPVAGHFTALVNGVMRAAARDPGSANGQARIVPAWLWRRWREAYGEMPARTILEAIATPADLDLSVKSDPAHWAEVLAGIVLPTNSVRVADKANVDTLEGFEEGAWWVQDAAAALPARLLGPVAGLEVADLCAAPGGKTAQLANAGARVTAVDISSRRLERLRSNLDRLGLKASTLRADLLTWSPDIRFDAILLDAPCSATGTIRRHPDVPYAHKEEDIEELASLQDRLLQRVRDWVKPGGTLVYCTCSLERAEGEDRIAGFLAENTGFARKPVTADEIGGLSEAITADGDVRTLPSHKFPGTDLAGMDGFYMARLVRNV